MKREMIEKLQRTIEIVNDSPTAVDVMVEFCIPDTEELQGNPETSENPHILLTYLEDEYSINTRKISLGNTALQTTPEDLSLHIMQEIAEFKDEIDDIVMG